MTGRYYHYWVLIKWSARGVITLHATNSGQLIYVQLVSWRTEREPRGGSKMEIRWDSNCKLSVPWSGAFVLYAIGISPSLGQKTRDKYRTVCAINAEQLKPRKHLALVIFNNRAMLTLTETVTQKRKTYATLMASCHTLNMFSWNMSAYL